MPSPHRDTILLEQAEVLGQTPWPGEQFVLAVQAPGIAARARPGTFAHLQCDPALPMRRPLSIMRAAPDSGRVDFLYKAVGTGTRLLGTRRAGETLSLLGPIGVPFEPRRNRRRALLLGGGVGIPPMVFLADWLRRQGGAWVPVVFMGSEVPFPFAVETSAIVVPGVDAAIAGTMPLLEHWGVACRLASTAGLERAYKGYVTDLARRWLDALPAGERDEVEVFACGPEPMLRAVAALAREYDLPCQVSLEEYMACGVGGCAGCAVEIKTETGNAMKRVCVDGPVFEAQAVFG